MPGILVGKGDKKVSKIWFPPQEVFMIDFICKKSAMAISTWGNLEKLPPGTIKPDIL